MRINFGCRNRLMTEHFLHRPQTCPPFDEVGCKRMTERMRTNRPTDSGCLSYILYNQKNHHPAQPSPAPIEKNEIFISLFKLHLLSIMGYVNHVVLYLIPT